MPLARWRVYQGGPQLWVAPTADDSDGWLASMRHIAIESGAHVISVPASGWRGVGAVLTIAVIESSSGCCVWSLPI